MKFDKSKIEFIGLISGLCVLLFFLIFDPISDPASNKMAGVALLMAIWWMTEALPLAATSLLPLFLYPFLEILPAKEISQQYINSTIFLFFGGFVLALAMKEWDLHKRISMHLIKLMGGGAKGILAGFMISSWLLSMFITNTATTIMMLPIALAVIIELESRIGEESSKNFAILLMLGIAYSASMGGVSTLVGTVPNLAFKSIFEEQYPNGPEISFASWMGFALPISVMMMLLLWFLMTKVLFIIDKNIQVDSSIINKELIALGKIQREEFTVLLIMTFTSLMWIFRKDIDLGFMLIPGWSSSLSFKEYIDDSTIAILMSSLLFILPANPKKKGRRAILGAEIIREIPWDILLLFGGGFALAKGFQITGLSELIGTYLASFGNFPGYIVAFIVCFVIIFLTELTSNTATTYTFLPILISISATMQINPLLLMIPATISASFAFMLPVATPPNAIVFSSGKLKIADMVKAGIWINLISAFLIHILFYFVGGFVLDIDPGIYPDWAK